MAAILDANRDQLKEDPLKGDNDPLKYDPMGKGAASQVATFDKDLGFAVQPWERDSIEAYRNDVDERVSKIEKSKGEYKSKFMSEMGKADAASAGLLSKFDRSNQAKAPRLVPVRVVNGNNVEATYYATKETIDKMNGGVFNKGDGSYVGNWVDGGMYNVDVTPRGVGNSYGKELHQMMKQVQDQTQAAIANSMGLANKTKDIQRNALLQAMDMQKSSAMATFDQSINQFDRAIQEIHGEYNDYIKRQQTAFSDGIRTNAGGIKDLLSSGVLEAK